MRAFRQWVVWKYVVRKEGSKPTKSPMQLNGRYAKTDNPETWCTFEEAIAAEGFE